MDAQKVYEVLENQITEIARRVKWFKDKGDTESQIVCEAQIEAILHVAYKLFSEDEERFALSGIMVSVLRGEK